MHKISNLKEVQGKLISENRRSSSSKMIIQSGKKNAIKLDYIGLMQLNKHCLADIIKKHTSCVFLL